MDVDFDFQTEFGQLSSSILHFFDSLTLPDLQREFEMAANDEDLAVINNDNDIDNDDNEENKTESETRRVRRNSVKEEDEDDMAVITTMETESTIKQESVMKTPVISPVKVRIPLSKQSNEYYNNINY